MSGQNKINLTVDVQGNVASFLNNIQTIQKSLNSLTLSGNIKNEATQLTDTLVERFNKIKQLTNNNNLNIIDTKTLQKELNAVETELNRFTKLTNSNLKGLDVSKNIKGYDSIVALIDDYNSKLQDSKNYIKEQTKEVDKLRFTYQQLSREKRNFEHDSSNNIAQLKSLVNSDYAAFQEAHKAQEAAQQKYDARFKGYKDNHKTDAQAENYAKNSNDYKELVKATNAAAEAQRNYNESQLLLQKTTQSNQKILSDYAQSVQTAKVAMESADAELQNFKNNLDNLSTEKFNELKTQLQDLFQKGQISFDPSELTNIDALKEKLSEISQTELTNISNSLQNLGTLASNTRLEVDSLGNSILHDVEAQRQFNSEVDRLKSRVAYFFGLTNAVMLFRRALRSAYNTVKDLDAVMTETAVVTDFSVGEMWDKLPEYTKRANELGVSIHSAYEAATIYYQQGLKTNEVMAVSNETLKMARIAGLDAATATDRMTNAMRGFNMAITEVNSQRVNDVYSQLAANTASNVDEISTAMTKVASLAHNANMEFETTSAFLAQMIETTRESAETAGTALKTVIARFSEVKKLYSEGDLLGTDEEGEEIDVNKVSTALRTAGINLNEYLTGAKGLDDIFIELASKWDSLDIIQQRYIATMAAGSRQQSRFIALMSDYKRTVELVDLANNSAGASNNQYQKTLDSLETKLSRLKNAWDEFIMGITNNTLIKAGVDVLKDLLTVINKITGILPGASSGIAKLGIAIGAFKLSKGFVNNGISSLINSFSTNLNVTSVNKSIKALNKYSASVSASGRLTRSMVANLNTLGQAYNLDAAELKLLQAEYIRTGQAEAALQNVSGKEVLVTNANLNAKNQLRLAQIDEQIRLKQFNLDLIKHAQLRYFASMSDEAMTWALEQEIVALEAERAAYQKSLPSLLLMLITKEGENDAIKRAIRLKIQDSNVMGVIDKLYKLLGGELIFNTTATEANTTATIANRIAKLGWIAAVVAAAAAVTALTVAIVKYTASLSNGAQLEYATDNLARLKANAQEAADALNSIIDESHNYNELQDTLDSLVTGTQEWRNALIEANQEVLNLLDSYPQLVNYLNTDSNGRLTIDSEGFNQVITQLQNNAKLLQAGTFVEQAHITSLSSQIKNEPFTFDEFDPYAQIKRDAYYSNLSEEELARISTEQLQSDSNVLSSIISGLSAAGIDSEIMDIIATNFNFEKLNSSYLDANWGRVGQDNNDKLTQIAQDNGIINFRANNKSDLEDLYKALGGTDDTEDMSAKELRKSIGFLSELNGELKKSANIAENYNKVSPKAQAAIKALGDGSDLTAKDLSELKIGDTLQEGLKEAADSFGIGADEFLKQFGFENFQAVKDNFDTIDSNYKQTIADMITKAMVNTSKIGERGSEDNQKLVTSANKISQYASTKQLDNYLSAYEQMFGKFGEDATNSFFDKFNTALEPRSNAFKQKILDLMSNIDFSDFDSLEEFKKEMKEINGIRKNDDLLELITNFEDLNNITREIDLSKLVNGFKDLLDLADEIEDKDELAGEGLSQEEYDSIIDKFPDMVDSFVFDGQEWQYVDGTMQQLAFELRENTTAIMGNTAELLEQQIQEKQKLVDKAENANLSEEFTSGALDENNFKDIKEGLSDMFGKAFISGLTNSEVMEKYKEVVNAFNTIGEDQAAFNQYKAEVAPAAAYQNLMNTNAANNSLNQSISYDMDAEALTKYDKLLDEQISKIDVLQEEIDFATKGFQKYGFSQEEAARRAKELIIQNDILESKIDNVRKAIGDELDVLNDSNKAEKEKVQSYKNIAVAATDLFGTDVSTEFVQNNINLFKELESGSVTAYQDICNKLNEETIKNWKLITTNTALGAEQVNNIINALDGLEFDVYGHADLSQLILAMLDAGMTAEEVMSKINSITGLSLNWNPSDAATIEHAYNMINSDRPAQVAAGMSLLEKTMSAGSFTTGPSPDFHPSGGGGYTPSGGSSGGGGGGSDKETKWENPYDELYNLTEKINENLRKREKLEREYDRILKNREATSKEIIQNSLDEIANLQREKDLQQQILDGRRRQIKNLGSQIYTDSEGNESSFSSLGVMKYAKYNFDSNTITIDWDGLEQIEDEEFGKAIEAYISKLEELQDQFEDTETRLEEIKDEIQEVKERNKQAYLELEERVYDALVEQRQKIIDEFESLSNTIEKSTGRIFNSIEQSIEDERRSRENDETEQNISEIESRLAYLQRDTSGGNALEIKQLEQELEKTRQDYSDRLVDQALQRMQDDADLAAQQRADQIEIMQAQLDWQEKSGYFWPQVYDLIHDSIDQDGTLAHNNQLVKLLEETNGFKGMSYFKADNWVEEMLHDWLEAQEGLSAWWLQEAEKEGSLQLDGNGEILTYNKDKQTWSDNKGNTYRDVYWDERSKQYKGTSNNDAPKPKTTTTTTTTKTTPSKPTLTDDIAKGIATAICLLGDPYQGGWGNWPDRETNLNNKFGSGAYNKVQGYVEAIAANGWVNIYGKDPSNYTIYKYKSGGLADYTGPAWLDGTKSKPEMVLNAKDTENFIQLRNILASLLQNTPKEEKQQSGGDNYFDINIQADIDSDYDVDQLAARIKKQIYDDSSYRNVNAINFIR